MLIKYGLKSLSFLFALWTQGMDAGYNRRLHACAGPNRASPPQPPRPVRCLSDFVYLSDTGVSPEKCIVCLSDTDVSSKKYLVSPADTLASPKKSRLCESLHRNGSFIHRTCKSLHRIVSNKPRVFLSHYSSESNKHSIFNSTRRIGSNIHCEYKPLYISDRPIQRISEPIYSLDSDIR